MSTKGIAVIGANFGDEGKGLVTDALTHLHKTGIVIRFNGGGQAGHTVKTPDGKCHVFSHIGSGTFAGAYTYLSRFFICNPRVFSAEYKVLSSMLPEPPCVFVHRDAIVTTPWDEIINQFLESARAGGRHGSVGLGIGETVGRCASSPSSLTVADLRDSKMLAEKVIHISTCWFPARLRSLHESGEFKDISLDLKAGILAVSKDRDSISTDFLRNVHEFLKGVTVVDSNCFIPNESPVIFEGAQGLLLDQKNGTFPHVTRSNTGLDNVLEICKEEDITLDEVVFVTRHYMTRHGAGPLPFEGRWEGEVHDDTNVPHAYQGKIRTGVLNWGPLQARIGTEMKKVPSGMASTVSLALTHCDNMKFPYRFVSPDADGFQMKNVSEEEFFNGPLLRSFNKVYRSDGPTRSTFKLVTQVNRSPYFA